MYADLFDVLDQCQFLVLSEREMVLLSLAWIKLPMDELAAFRATMPSLRRASLELLREAREDGL
jgi:hypothetical protein